MFSNIDYNLFIVNYSNLTNKINFIHIQIKDLKILHEK